jgi:mannose-1-phosphate guanylyltransferase
MMSGLPRLSWSPMKNIGSSSPSNCARLRWCRGALLLEPISRNTAPAVCVAALARSETDPDPLMLVMPSDRGVVTHDRVAHGQARRNAFVERSDIGQAVTCG